MSGKGSEKKGIYESLAPYYRKHVMALARYEALGDQLRAIWEGEGIVPRDVLELGAGDCPFLGTGLYPANARVVFTDLSMAMLGRAGRLPARNFLAAADASAIPLRGPFDLCIMTFNAFNYLLEPSQAMGCLREVRRVLAPGALFLLDILSERILSAPGRRLTEHSPENTFIWDRHHYPKEKSILHEFTLYTPGDGDAWRRVREVHLQRVYKLTRFRRMAVLAGFREVGCFEPGLMQPPGPNSFAALLALRNPRPAL